MNNSNQNEQLKIKKLLNHIYDFSSHCLQDFHSFNIKYLEYLDPKTNFAEEIDENTPQLISDLLSHLGNAEKEILSVNNFCNGYLFKGFSLSLEEMDMIKESINSRIEQGIKANRILTDKIDLESLYDLQAKFI